MKVIQQRISRFFLFFFSLLSFFLLLIACQESHRRKSPRERKKKKKKTKRRRNSFENRRRHVSSVNIFIELVPSISIPPSHDRNEFAEFAANTFEALLDFEARHNPSRFNYRAAITMRRVLVTVNHRDR